MTTVSATHFRSVALGLVLGVLPAAAQVPTTVTLHGIAYDSLHIHPLNGAFIALAGTPRSTTSDSSGHFTFDSVAPGTYRLVMQHDVLDALGIFSAMSRAVVTDGKDTARVSVPSFTTLWKSVCRTAKAPADSGFLFGTVHVAPGMKAPAGAKVSASWLDVRFDRAKGVLQNHWRLDVIADSSGGYALCGIPMTTGVRIRAVIDSVTVGQLDLMPLDQERISKRDVTVNPPTVDSLAKGAIAGTVTGSGGTPLRNAVVVLDGLPEVRTRPDGQFILRGVPIGQQQIEVRALGLAPVFKLVDVTVHDTARADVRLEKVTMLDSVLVTASGVRDGLIAEINARQKAGFGYFRDSIAVMKKATLIDVFKDLPSVFVVQRRDSFQVQMSGTNANKPKCVPTLWIDGKKEQFLTVPEYERLKMYRPEDIAMIEVYPRMMTAPAQYVSQNVDLVACGVVLVWTKRIVP